MLARVEKLDMISSSVKARHQYSLGPDGHSTAQKVRCWMLSPTKISGFFNRIDVFEKIDQVLEPGATNASFNLSPFSDCRVLGRAQ